jgi:hypothetical protein
MIPEPEIPMEELNRLNAEEDALIDDGAFDDEPECVWED